MAWDDNWGGYLDNIDWYSNKRGAHSFWKRGAHSDISSGPRQSWVQKGLQEGQAPSRYAMWRSARRAQPLIPILHTEDTALKYLGNTLMGRTGLARAGRSVYDTTFRAAMSYPGMEMGFAAAFTLGSTERGGPMVSNFYKNLTSGVVTGQSINFASKLLGVVLGRPGLATAAVAAAYVGTSLLGINPVEHLMEFSKEKLQGLDQLRGIAKPLTQTVTTMKHTESQLRMLGQMGQYSMLGSEASYMHN